MKKQLITKKDIFNDDFERDCELLKLCIRLLWFLNIITFKIFEKRLEYQLEKVYGLWMQKLENGDYFVKQK